MSEAEMNSYRLTSMEEPGDERMAQIMREVAEDARESTRRAAARVAAGIEAATHEARARVEETLNYKIPELGVISRPAASTSCRSFFITSAVIHLLATLTVLTRLRLRTMSIGANLLLSSAFLSRSLRS